MEAPKENQLNKKRISQPFRQRIILLSVLAYEALGCIVGGIMLIVAPDGRYMDMPVNIMHKAFPDFLIPGIILFALGILNTLAFISLLRKSDKDWIMAGLALCGLYIWFVVEIIILQELHWLHLMWGIPVLLGWLYAIPLIILRNNTPKFRNALLYCGIVSSLWYVAINIYVQQLYVGYDIFKLTVSEMSAIGAPTRIVWVLLATFYLFLLMAFGWGVLYVAKENRNLRMAGSILIAYSILNFYWPPMHQREVIASGGGTLTDTLHIVWASIALIFNMLLMWYGAMAFGWRFRIYTFSTWIIFIIFGVLTFKESQGINANLPTPHLGLWERINMGAFLLWIVVFAFVISSKTKMPSTIQINKTFE